MGDQSTNTSSLLVPDGFRSLDSDDESEADSLHMESAEDITLPFSTHLPDFLPSCLDTVTVTLGPEGCVKDNPCNELVANITDRPNGTDTSNLPPVTPTKPLDTPTALHPLTPTANLKLLMSAVSPEIRSMEKRQKSKALFNAIVQAASQENLELQQSIEYEVDVETSSQDDDYVDDGEKPANRKAKSLGLLCQRFLSKYPDYPIDGQAMEISLDAISKELCVERRRIYDIVNVLESVEMVQRQAKNKYLWHGKTYLIQTLVKLKCLGERNDYANQMERLKKLQVERDYQQEMSNGGSRSKKAPLKDFTNTAGQQMAGKRFLEDDPNARKDKSLGVMSQKFIMLFLVSKNQLVTLDIAARVLIGDINYEIVENSKFKTKVRRLYDIANILTSLRMIKKVHIHERRGRKPAFRWIGPNPDIADIDLSQYDLQSKPVFRHSHFPPPAATSTSVSSTSAYLAPIRPKSRGKKTASFTRHSSFNIMRKLTTGDADNRHCSSAPSSPAKMTVSKETNEKFQREFDNLRTKYPDCMSKLFAACNIEKERMQQQEHEQQLISVDDAAEDLDQFEVSDQLQTARKVLNLDDGEESMDKSQTADSEELVLSNMLTETVDSLNCALRDADKMREANAPSSNL
ncbi:transcription factor E2F8-like isoform X2 [Amphiura filiformis]